MRVSVYHNVAPDIAARMVYGYQPGQPLVHVFQADVSPGDGGTAADELAEWIWMACNIGHELDARPRMRAVATAYRHCGLRSLPVGDVVAIGDGRDRTVLSVVGSGFAPVDGSLHIVTEHQHGTWPWSASARTVTVWILRRWDRHDEEVSPHPAREDAISQLAAHARSCWNTIAGADGVPATPPGRDQEATDIYYGLAGSDSHPPCGDDEGYSLGTIDVTCPPAAPPPAIAAAHPCLALDLDRRRPRHLRPVQPHQAGPAGRWELAGRGHRRHPPGLAYRLRARHRRRCPGLALTARRPRLRPRKGPRCGLLRPRVAAPSRPARCACCSTSSPATKEPEMTTWTHQALHDAIAAIYPSAPPDDPAAAQVDEPAQRRIVGPWAFDVDAAAEIIRRRPRRTTRLPVPAWSRACGLDQDPDSGSGSGPGQGLDRAYALTTDLSEPLIIAAVPLPSLSAAYNVLLDGRHRLYRAHVEGVASLPGWLLTDDETVAILTCRPGAAVRPATAARPA